MSSLSNMQISLSSESISWQISSANKSADISVWHMSKFGCKFLTWLAKCVGSLNVKGQTLQLNVCRLYWCMRRWFFKSDDCLNELEQNWQPNGLSVKWRTRWVSKLVFKWNSLLHLWHLCFAPSCVLLWLSRDRCVLNCLSHSSQE